MNNILELFNSYLSGDANIFLPLILLFAFLAGILSSVTPCSLGMLPLIIAYVGGYSSDGNKKLFAQMLFFSFGLATVLSIIGVLCALTGRAFTGVASPLLILIFASLFILLGLNLIGFLDINLPSFIKEMPKNKSGSTFLYPFIVGCVFALASSPCSTPILLTIMAIAAITKNIIFAILLLFCFAIGQCVIIIIFAMFASLLKNMPSIAKYSDLLMKISGFILIITGLVICYLVLSSI